MNTVPLLIEILTEELPFSGIKKEIKNIKTKFHSILKDNNIDAIVDFFWTPRRLIFTSKQFPISQDKQTKEYFGPPINIAYDKDGNLTEAGKSFINKVNITQNQLKTSYKNNKECLYYEITTNGNKTSVIIETVITQLLDSINFGKTMRWGMVEHGFIRPIRNIIALIGDEFIPLKTLEKKYHFHQQQIIYPHRATQPKELFDIDSYFGYIKSNGVIYSQDERKNIIVEQINSIEVKNNIQVEIDPELLDEVIAITELPNALYGEFDSKFLSLPEEVIITSMKTNQKYFPVYKDNKLHNSFVVVCNTLDKKCFDNVLLGNKRVLRARLEDALFFYNNDLQTFSQYEIDAKLKNIEFIQGCGNIYDKINREISIAKTLINNNVNANNILESIKIGKNDLISEMVGEFGELQGIMSSYYTSNNSLKTILKEQYLPINEDSNLPSTIEAGIVSIANKLDLIISLFSINKIPTGSKDPFGLRRACSGIIRIIIKFNIPFNIKNILEQLKNNYNNINESNIINFFHERMAGVLLVNQSIINAAIKSNQMDMLELTKQIYALNNINNNNEFKNLFKRIANILKNTQSYAQEINQELLMQKEEITLFNKLIAFKKIDIESPEQRIKELLMFKTPLQDFFENVMINTSDEKIRINRTLLVKCIYEEFFKLGDIKEISF